MSWGYEFRPYVTVAQRRAKAAKEIARRTKSGKAVAPVLIRGRKITTTFWGDAWCHNLEHYSDYANRLPRGRTYVRNGSVVDLQVGKGRIRALVSGSELYEIQIDIAPLPKKTWIGLKKQCAGKIGTLVELLQGKLSKAVMELVTDPRQGLFPKPTEIEIECSCPDYAGMCKHVAAVMYGVGSRLDSSPELLFVLRAVDHLELIEQALPAPTKPSEKGARAIATADLEAIFDIEIGDDPNAGTSTKIRKDPAAKRAKTKPVERPKASAKKKKMAGRSSGKR